MVGGRFFSHIPPISCHISHPPVSITCHTHPPPPGMAGRMGHPHHTHPTPSPPHTCLPTGYTHTCPAERRFCSRGAAPGARATRTFSCITTTRGRFSCITTTHTRLSNTTTTHGCHWWWQQSTSTSTTHSTHQQHHAPPYITSAVCMCSRHCCGVELCGDGSPSSRCTSICTPPQTQPAGVGAYNTCTAVGSYVCNRDMAKYGGAAATSTSSAWYVCGGEKGGVMCMCV